MSSKRSFAVWVLAGGCTFSAGCAPNPTEPSTVGADSALAGSRPQTVAAAAASDDSSRSASTVDPGSSGDTLAGLDERRNAAFVKRVKCVPDNGSLGRNLCAATFEWSVRTPGGAGDGKATCPIVVQVKKRVLEKDPTAKIQFALGLADLGFNSEARVSIPMDGVTPGVEPSVLDTSLLRSCREFKRRRFATQKFLLKKFRKPNKTLVRRQLRLRLHAHEGGDCLAAGHATGSLQIVVHGGRENILFKRGDLTIVQNQSCT